MAAWRYEISLLVLKIFQHSKINFVSSYGHVIFSIYQSLHASNNIFLPYIEEASKSKKHDCYPKPVQHIFGLF